MFIIYLLSLCICCRNSNKAVEVIEDDDDGEGEDSEVNNKAMAKRKIRREWFIDFQWLKLDHSTQSFYCVLCRRYQQPGVFTAGKSLSNPKKDNFAKHEETEGHKIAALQDMGMSEQEAMDVVKKDTVVEGDGKRSDVKPPRELDDGSFAEGSVAPVSAQEFLAFCAEKRGPSNRRIQLEWFLEHPWLEVDRKRAVFLCKYCRVYRPLGVFVAGKPIEDPKQDELKKHEETEGHKEAVKSYDKDANVATRPDLKGSSIGVVDASMVLSYTSTLGSTASNVRSTLMMHYPWLQHDAQNNVHICLPCRECGWQAPGDTTTPVSYVWSGQISKESLEQHDMSKSHRAALVKFRDMQKGGTEAPVQLVYYLFTYVYVHLI